MTSEISAFLLLFFPYFLQLMEDHYHYIFTFFIPYLRLHLIKKRVKIRLKRLLDVIIVTW